MNQKLIENVRHYFESTGVFAVRRDYESQPGSDFEPVFVPFFKQLPTEEQRQLIRLLAETAVGLHPELEGRDGEAMRILNQFRFPWPEDYRLLLQQEAKAIVLREFSADHNLMLWSAWERDSSSIGWAYGPGYALCLYGILLTIASDEELSLPVNRLVAEARDNRFRRVLRQAPRIYDGIRLCSYPQLSKTEFINHSRQVRREMMRGSS